MASSARPELGLMANAVKNKHSFFHLFAMTGILLLSMRSAGQKYRAYNLEEDIAALEEEKEKLNNRFKHIKSNLLNEASLDPSGVFASRLRLLFGDDE